MTHDAAAASLWAYVGVAGAVDLYGQGYDGCDAAALPVPTAEPRGLVAPQAFPPDTIFNIPSGPLFNGFQRLAVMGTYGLHVGTSVLQLGSTLDIVPANIELCIDSELPVSDCDTLEEIPVLSPVNGCAILAMSNEQTNILVNIGLRDGNACNQAPSTGQGQIVITHVRVNGIIINGQLLTTGRYIPVSMGDIIGYLCKSSDAVRLCGVNDSDGTQTHVAFQLQIFDTSRTRNGFQRQRPCDVLPFLQSSGALYDVWASSLRPIPQPVRQSSSLLCQ